jgi:hypothetical protein
VSSKAPSVFVYGAGRVGLAIANLARERGVDVVGLWNPHPLKPRRAALAKGFDLAINGQPPAIRGLRCPTTRSAPPPSGWLLLRVPDLPSPPTVLAPIRPVSCSRYRGTA